MHKTVNSSNNWEVQSIKISGKLNGHIPRFGGRIGRSAVLKQCLFQILHIASWGNILKAKR